MSKLCFSYSSDLPREAGGGGEMGPCFSLPAGLPRRGLRRMPVFACFTYPADVPLSIRNRGATAGDRPRKPPGKPATDCFSYQA
jgi:hypothetical protein